MNDGENAVTKLEDLLLEEIRCVLIRNRSVDFFRNVLTRILILETLRKSDDP